MKDKGFINDPFMLPYTIFIACNLFVCLILFHGLLASTKICDFDTATLALFIYLLASMLLLLVLLFHDNYLNMLIVAILLVIGMLFQHYTF